MLPSGKLTKNYGKIHHFHGVNPLFLWQFSIAFCMFTRPGKPSWSLPSWDDFWGMASLAVWNSFAAHCLGILGVLATGGNPGALGVGVEMSKTNPSRHQILIHYWMLFVFVSQVFCNILSFAQSGFEKLRDVDHPNMQKEAGCRSFPCVNHTDLWFPWRQATWLWCVSSTWNAGCAQRNKLATSKPI